jgi:hypothetical protein
MSGGVIVAVFDLRRHAHETRNVIAPIDFAQKVRSSGIGYTKPRHPAGVLNEVIDFIWALDDRP